ncbi:acyl-CoA thioesterase [Alkaliphilus crotonatoxidans]
MRHEYVLEVRGYELDSFNHVNNAVYLNYIEVARWQFLKEVKWLDYMLEHSLQAIVIETNIRYIGELRVFDRAVIKSQWYYDGNYLIANQSIYREDTRKRVTKATVKMLLVSNDRIIHEIPPFMKEQMDQEGSL